MIVFARIFLKDGLETADRLFEGLTVYATRKAGSNISRLEHRVVRQMFSILAAKNLGMDVSRTRTDIPRFEHPIVQHIGKDIAIPKKSAFGIGASEQSLSLVFPAMLPRKHLWDNLKRAKSTKETQRVADRIARSMPLIPGLSAFRRALRRHGAELYRAKRLWTYPQTDRSKSDDKRIEFFAKTLAGLMLGLSPATAMKRLSRWRLPKLWIKEIEQ